MPPSDGSERKWGPNGTEHISGGTPGRPVATRGPRFLAVSVSVSVSVSRQFPRTWVVQQTQQQEQASRFKADLLRSEPASPACAWVSVCARVRVWTGLRTVPDQTSEAEGLICQYTSVRGVSIPGVEIIAAPIGGPTPSPNPSQFCSCCWVLPPSLLLSEGVPPPAHIGGFTDWHRSRWRRKPL